MTPEARPEVATHGDRPAAPELRHRNVLSIHPPVSLSEGEVVPAVLTIDVGDKIHLAIPPKSSQSSWTTGQSESWICSSW